MKCQEVHFKGYQAQRHCTAACAALRQDFTTLQSYLSSSNFSLHLDACKVNSKLSTMLQATNNLPSLNPCSYFAKSRIIGRRVYWPHITAVIQVINIQQMTAADHLPTLWTCISCIWEAVIHLMTLHQKKHEACNFLSSPSVSVSHDVYQLWRYFRCHLGQDKGSRSDECAPDQTCKLASD